MEPIAGPFLGPWHTHSVQEASHRSYRDLDQLPFAANAVLYDGSKHCAKSGNAFGLENVQLDEQQCQPKWHRELSGISVAIPLQQKRTQRKSITAVNNSHINIDLQGVLPNSENRKSREPTEAWRKSEPTRERPVQQVVVPTESRLRSGGASSPATPLKKKRTQRKSVATENNSHINNDLHRFHGILEI